MVPNDVIVAPLPPPPQDVEEGGGDEPDEEGQLGPNSIEINIGPKVDLKTGPRCKIEKGRCRNYLKAYEYTSLPEFGPKNCPKNWPKNWP